MPKSKSTGSDSTPITIKRGSGNVFKDTGFDDVEAAHLFIRANLMIEIIKTIDTRGWTATAAAQALQVNLPRISELRQGRVDKFSVDLLLRYLARLGKEVALCVKDRAAA